jgi:hypothetical protein
MPHLVPLEVVPAALGVRVVVRALLIPFAALAGYVVAWGLVYVMDAVIRAFFGTAASAVGWIPGVGRLVQSPIVAIEHKLTSFLGGMEVHFERQMAARWHALAGLVSGLAADTKAAAIFDYHIAQRLATVYGLLAEGRPGAAWRALIKAQQAQTKAAQDAAMQAKKAALAAQAAASTGVAVPHPSTQTIIRTYPAGKIGTHVRALESELAHVIDLDIPGLRARDRVITDSLGRLWHRVRGERKAIGLGAFTALLVVALGKLGLGNLRCLNRKHALKTVCGMNPNLLEALLTGTAVIGGSISVVQLAKACQEITGACTDGASFFVRELK